jgi:hypothetical protein
VRFSSLSIVYVDILAAVIMDEQSNAQIINLEHWMSNLPEQVKDVPLIYLAIPGKLTL